MRRLDTFPAEGGRNLYDWVRIFDGSVWELEQGSDFQPTPVEFRAQVYQAASKRGLKARTHLPEDRPRIIVVQAVMT